MKRVLIISLLLLPSCLSLITFGRDMRTERNNSTIRINFDITSVEKIYLAPEEILKNPERFWGEDKAYILTTQYHYNNKIPVPMKRWKERMNQLYRLSGNDSIAQQALLTARRIIALKNKFEDEAIGHLCSFLTVPAPDININVYFTAEIEPAAFAYKDGIVMNVASPRFNYDPNVILNIIVHEAFHYCYYSALSKRGESKIENESASFIDNFLLNEGWATYVSYTARNIFPNDFVPDYKMINNESELNTHLKNINYLLSQTAVLRPDSLKKLTWRIGVLNRSFYVAGAYMAMKIDNNLGRDKLIAAACMGPRTFIQQYNSLVDDKKRIAGF